MGSVVGRLCGAGAAAAGLAAGIGLLAAGAGARTSDYLSELGVDGQPAAGRYRVSVWCAAVGIALLGVALARIDALLTAAIVAAVPLFVASGAVTCSPGCPLPPYDTGVTPQDLVHAAASTAGFGAAVVAMALLALHHADDVVRVVSRICAGLAGLFVFATGVAMLAATHGTVHGMLERGATLVALGWLVVIGARLAVIARPSGVPHATGIQRNDRRGDR